MVMAQKRLQHLPVGGKPIGPEVLAHQLARCLELFVHERQRTLAGRRVLELFEAFRAETDAALVGISARSSVSDRIAGLKLGADDYVTKPFALEELMARVEAVIRRHRGKGGARLSASDVVVDLSEGIATRGGRRLTLTGIEFRILTALMRSSGQLVTYAQLAEAVWAVTTGPESNSLEVHISRIRQKLEQDEGSRLIHTVRGLGYRFGPE